MFLPKSRRKGFADGCVGGCADACAEDGVDISSGCAVGVDGVEEGEEGTDEDKSITCGFSGEVGRVGEFGWVGRGVVGTKFGIICCEVDKFKFKIGVWVGGEFGGLTGFEVLGGFCKLGSNGVCGVDNFGDLGGFVVCSVFVGLVGLFVEFVGLFVGLFELFGGFDGVARGIVFGGFGGFC